MIKHILEMLPYVEGGSELIDIAKGKYKYPGLAKNNAIAGFTVNPGGNEPDELKKLCRKRTKAR